MYSEILTPAQGVVLDTLRPILEGRTFYLAGGTAVALHHGHRRSIDFDFFDSSRFDVEELLRELENAFDKVDRVSRDDRTLNVKLSGVSASFFHYRYPLLEELEETEWGFGLASDEDLAAMKIEAIADRGSIKDFVDLRTLCPSGLELEKAFASFDRKYGLDRSEQYHRIRSLSYFEDAEREKLPEMLVPFDWEETKRFFTAEAQRMLEELMSEN